jgi:hypothetical protein
MGTQFDLITPVVIVGILMVLVVGMQQFMLETSAETRLINRDQAEIGIGLQLVQEELRGLTDIETLTDSTIVYATATTDTVAIRRMNGELQIIRNSSDTLKFDIGLTGIDFTLLSDSGAAPFFLRMRLTADGAAVQRDYYLRNLN